ncbi:MAG: glucans biosynthesis glucosyltransferase MdoH [Rubrivivax sp.]
MNHVCSTAESASAWSQPTELQRLAARTRQRRYTHAAAPAIRRGSMPAQPWLGFKGGVGAALRLSRTTIDAAASAAAPTLRLHGWQRAAHKRRSVLMALVLLAAVLSASLLLVSQPADGFDALHLAQVGLFSLLFAWVTAGCVTAVMGWRVLRSGDPHMLSHRKVAHDPIAADARTALVMPICNEDVATVFAGLNASAESLVAAGGARLVEIYLLSDSSDPLLRATERLAALALRERFAGHGLRVHYRWRLRRNKRKSGNVADFCRRWGGRHRYMVVFDADSVMSGEAVLGLVRLMEAHPQAGIVQSAPVACGVATPHARSQQFAGRVTGRLFSAGMQYWQLGESHYWGHTAIIRIAPFMAHCGLAALKGNGGLSGEILSHDFVEAALMRRAGYQVWLVPDLPGSWEQQPPHLLAELQRDRRWCQGNLQNARLIAEPNLHRVHRAMFATGAMAYLSAPLWLAFVVLGAVLRQTGGHLMQTPSVWPSALLMLWASTIGLLMLPRMLGVALVLQERQEALYGGRRGLIVSAVLEAITSALQAPVRMAAHSLFVFGALTGLKLQWKSPPRQAERLRWRDAAGAMLPLSLVAAAVLGAAAWTVPAMVWWLAPVTLPLLLSWPLTVWAGSPRLGLAMRRAGILLTPEEVAPAPALRRAWGVVGSGSASSADEPARGIEGMHDAAHAGLLKLAA